MSSFFLPAVSCGCIRMGRDQSLMREQVMLVKHANKTKQNTQKKTQSHEKISK